MLVRRLQEEEAEASGVLYVFVTLPFCQLPVAYKDELPQVPPPPPGQRPVNPVVQYWKEFAKFVGEDPTEVEPSGRSYTHLLVRQAREIHFDCLVVT